MAHLAAFTIAVFMLFGIVYWSTVQEVNAQLENEIREELNAFVDEYAVEGQNEIRNEIQRRLDGDRGDAYMLLQDAQGRRIAGNLPEMPPEPGWRDIAPQPDPLTHARHKEHVVRAKAASLSDGSYLVVGRDTHPLHELREIIVRGFLYGGLATVLVALCIGVSTSIGVLRRLQSISDTSQEIMGGDLSRRLAIGRHGDEFDELAGQVNLMLDRIQRLVEDLKQVTTDIAHDLRTPLTRLRHRLETALAPMTPGCQPGCPSRQEIVYALPEADALLRTFAAMLRIAEIDAGTRRAGFRPVDLSALFANLVETYALVAEEAGHRLLARIEPGHTVSGDAELITQMSVNLIENAIEHTPRGSTITLCLSETGCGLRAVVADDGPGIPESLQSQVCKRFVRLQSSRTTPGSGLGLSLVAAVAQLHDIALAFTDNHPGLCVQLTWSRSLPSGGTTGAGSPSLRTPERMAKA